MLLLQIAQDIKPWYDNTAIIGPIIGLITGIVMLTLNKWWEKRQENIKEEKKNERLESDEHSTLIGKLSEISSVERKEYREAFNLLHVKEIDFYQAQIKAKDIALIAAKQSELSSRIRAQRVSNENSRLQNYIIIVTAITQKFGIVIPGFKFETPEMTLEQQEIELNILKDTSNILELTVGETEMDDELKSRVIDDLKNNKFFGDTDTDTLDKIDRSHYE